MDLRASLATALWIDQTHVEANLGGMVFQREKQAVQKLDELLKSKQSKLPKATLRDFIDRLVGADRLLAVVALDEAETAGANPKQLALASRQLARGDELVAGGRFSDAIEAYRIAWMEALRSLRPHSAAGD